MDEQKQEPKTYDQADIDRLSRKIQLLLNKHPGKDLLKILKESSKIKDEFISILDMSNCKLEAHIDVAIANT